MSFNPTLRTFAKPPGPLGTIYDLVEHDQHKQATAEVWKLLQPLADEGLVERLGELLDQVEHNKLVGSWPAYCAFLSSTKHVRAKLPQWESFAEKLRVSLLHSCLPEDQIGAMLAALESGELPEVEPFEPGKIWTKVAPR